MQCLGNAKAEDSGLLLGDAAKAIGVSADTLRRWERAGKLRTKRDSAQPPARAARARSSACRGAPQRAPRRRLASRRATASRAWSRSVEVDGVMALVEIEAGPHRITAAITRDAVEELGLAPGVAGHRGGEGHVGDGGARVRRSRCCSPRSRCFAAGCGDDDDGGGAALPSRARGLGRVLA